MSRQQLSLPAEDCASRLWRMTQFISAERNRAGHFVAVGEGGGEGFEAPRDSFDPPQSPFD